MNQKHVKKEKMIELMNSVGYSTQTISKCRYRVDQYINYVSNNSLSISYDSVMMYINNLQNSKNKKRSDNYLHETKVYCLRFVRFIENGSLDTQYSKDYLLSGNYSESMNGFIDDLSTKLAPQTLVNYRHHLKLFQEYLISNEIKEITAKTITEYFLEFSRSNSKPHPRYHLKTILKKYLKYLYTNRITKSDLSVHVPNVKYEKRKELPSTYTSDEIKAILDSIDRTSTIGKRNYAMISLAVYYGLRAKDITDLKFANIDWANNIIHLEMSKTKKDIELPLLPEVGNAILDYIKKGRRTCSVKNIFITDKGPIRAIHSNAVYTAILNQINATKIERKGRKVGAHSLRHSLATRLLKKGEPLPTISMALGHSSTQVTTVYTLIDIDSLRACALEVPELSSPAYGYRGL